MINLSEFTQQRKAWGFLALSALSLELIALYFQYGMDLLPCMMCVYQRTAVAGVLLAGLIGLAQPKLLSVRLVAFGFWGVSAIWGFLLAKEHVAMQNETNPFLVSCGFVPDYPSWMPLHDWFPGIFNPTGTCDKIDWMFLGLSMPGWMQVLFAGYSLAFIAFLALNFIKQEN